MSGRTLSETASYDSESGKTTSYAYDAEGRLIKVTYPSGSGLGTLNYTYDTFGNIQNIKKGSSTVREYVYDAFNRVTSIKDYDKPGSSSFILKSYTYDDFGRTISAVYTEDGDAAKVLESYAYTYDKNDNILSETRISNLPVEASVINETRAYVYDAYGRLTKSTKTDHTDGDSQFVTTYEYDAVGNRVKMIEGGLVTTYDYNGLNQLEKADTTDYEIEYTYDERGNQVLESNTTTEETVETTYNVAGEMVQLVKKSGGTTTLTQTNVYNQDGIRISRTQGDTEREYYYNNGVVGYTEDNNSLSSANIQNYDGDVIGTYRGSRYYNYFKNMQESTESIISESGATAAVYTYSDFGETEEVVVDTIGNEICYTGAIYDKDTGLYYMNARYYDAETGRFISQDSYRGEIDDAGTWHLYAYCSNDPVNNIDLCGHAWMTLTTINRRAKNDKQKTAQNVMKRYRANVKAVNSRNKYSELYKYIKDQNLYPYIKFRSTNIKESGCGIVAVFKVLKKNKKTLHLLRLTAEFDYQMSSSGKNGIKYFTVNAALKKYAPTISYFNLAEFTLNLKDGDSGILLYQHSGGGHYVSVEKENGNIKLRNRKGKNTTVKTNLKKFLNNNGYKFSWGAIIK